MSPKEEDVPLRIHPKQTDLCDCGHDSDSHHTGLGFCFGCRNSYETREERREYDQAYENDKCRLGETKRCGGFTSKKFLVAKAVEQSGALNRKDLNKEDAQKEASSLAFGWTVMYLKRYKQDTNFEEVRELIQEVIVDAVEYARWAAQREKKKK